MRLMQRQWKATLTSWSTLLQLTMILLLTWTCSPTTASKFLSAYPQSFELPCFPIGCSKKDDCRVIDWRHQRDTGDVGLLCQARYHLPSWGDPCRSWEGERSLWAGCEVWCEISLRHRHCDFCVIFLVIWYNFANEPLFALFCTLAVDRFPTLAQRRHWRV